MAEVVTVAMNLTFNGAVTPLGTFTASGDTYLAQALTYLASDTNVLRSLAIPTASGRLQMVALIATSALTIKTNSSGSPTDTITLTANNALVWVRGGGTQPFQATPDVSAFYLSNTDATAGTLTVIAVFNSH